jgi:hypothetical protein
MLVTIVTGISSVLFSYHAFGATFAGPVGGAAIILPGGRIGCGITGTGWQLDSTRGSVVPPKDLTQVGATAQVRVAASAADCATTKDVLTFIAYGRLPVIDARTVELWVDEGRVELHGSGLDGVRLEWETKGNKGSDVCLAPTTSGSQQTCSFLVSKSFPADMAASTLRWLPAGLPAQTEVFGDSGFPIAKEALAVSPARVVISKPLANDSHVDLSNGEERLELEHPEAIAGVDCDNARCDLTEDEVRIRGGNVSTRAIQLRVRLIPHVVVRSQDTFLTNVVLPLEVTFCPLAIVSPPPLRDIDDVRVVVRADVRCGATSENVRWTANGNPISIVDTETKEDSVYFLLGLGHISSERLTLAALKGTSDAPIIGSMTVPTVLPGQIRTVLQLEGFGEIDFVPTNRSATVSVTAPGLHGQLVPLPIPGAYSVDTNGKLPTIRGESEGGYVVLRFALRDSSLPGYLAEADLAKFSSNVQRAIKEVNVATPLVPTNPKSFIAEVICTEASGRDVAVLPGVPLHIPYPQREGCRLILHRERIPAEDGEQQINLAIDVVSMSGSTRPEGHLVQRLLLRHGSQPRVIWLRGVRSQFDRITVSLSHVTSEPQYLHGPSEQLELPAGQWTVVVENTRWRLYATAAIPVQLFRFTNQSSGAGTGPLSLNLGVLSRFTWVTKDGTEGILGLETGVMGMGLSANNTRQLNIVGGLGLAVPLGNAGQATQASINIHAWAAYRLGDEYASPLDESGNAIEGKSVKLKPWAFIFGPSVTFGNLGIDL